jgi:DNA-binding CsgD family transcriptional regulator
MPTKRELEVLLTMCQTGSAKYVAKKLNLSPKTIDENKARLRDKLKLTTLDALIIKLHELRCHLTCDFAGRTLRFNLYLCHPQNRLYTFPSILYDCIRFNSITNRVHPSSPCNSHR